jgi:type II secretory pathway predicted ATPase ExeA
MKPQYRTFFGLNREPFTSEIKPEEILKTEEVLAVADRFDYALRIGAIAVVTGEVGSGKSTALRWATSRLHPSEYFLIWVTASSGSILELYRQVCSGLDLYTASGSRAVLTRTIRRQVLEMANAQKRKPVLIIDEANLLRIEVFAELHTLSQFQADSQALLPMILAGQNNLIDHLLYRTSQPLSSRVVARSHLEGASREQMLAYLNHHLSIAGIKQPLFSEAAVTAIHQGSGGLFRRANHLARGALIAAANEKCQQIAAEHVRIASTELI